MRRIGQFISAEIFCEPLAVVRWKTEAAIHIGWSAGVNARWIESGISRNIKNGAGKKGTIVHTIYGVLLVVLKRDWIQVGIVCNSTRGNCRTTLSAAPAVPLHQSFDDIGRKYAIGRLRRERSEQYPSRSARCTIYQIYRPRAVGHPRGFIPPRKLESEPRERFIACFQFAAFDCCIKVQIDRGSIDDFRYLISFVVIVERAGIECERAIQQCVLAAKFECIDVF